MQDAAFHLFRRIRTGIRNADNGPAQPGEILPAGGTEEKYEAYPALSTICNLDDNNNYKCKSKRLRFESKNVTF